MDIVLSAGYYLIIAFIALGLAMLLAGIKKFLPFRNRLGCINDTKLILPFFLIIFGLALLSPLLYPYAFYYISPTPQISEGANANSVSTGLSDKGGKQGKGMDGSIIIVPSVKLKSGIKDTLDKDEMQTAAAHVPWTALPGEKGMMMIIGENYMHQLRGGPNVLFTTLHLVKPKAKVEIDFKNKKYAYEVKDTKVITPAELEKLAVKGDTEQLILVTCFPPGTQDNRFVVFADPV